ncbi:PQQ-dependent sugar dehydrogenase [Luteimonas terricola]|uniref:Glucose dehydrogenase n=1 Tax=Luteimonas terricola TaxID=645597 RepID=A0ABQ2EH26_9GAMM|nr:PQQ-dependent sugar dehydrogenase [Luteimonas terricola]GGK08980.1 glucose dehydrogenase [Luteimonas terricola]
MDAKLAAVLLFAALSPGCAESAVPTAIEAASTRAATAAQAAPGTAGGGIRVEQVLREGLQFPTAVASPRDGSGRMFVLEREGRIRVLDRDGKLLQEPYYERDVTTNDIEQGLLGLAFDPGFRSNGRLYIAYSGASEGERYGLVLRRLQAADPAANRFDGKDDLLMRVEGLVANHNGGDIHFGPDGMLYWAIGAGTGEPADHVHASKTDNLLGKILRIDVSDGATGARNACGGKGRAAYSVPADNPFAGKRGECGEIWVHGLRNPWRFGIDASNGDLWIGDVGKDREEISLFRAGDSGNLGYPGCQGSHAYPSTGASDCPEKTGTTGPVFDHDRGVNGRCAVTGGLVYRGAFPALKGAYVFSDSCSSELLVGRLSATGRLEVESIDSGIAPGYGTVASFGEDEDNELWFVNHQNGGLYRIRDAD